MILEGSILLCYWITINQRPATATAEEWGADKEIKETEEGEDIQAVVTENLMTAVIEEIQADFREIPAVEVPISQPAGFWNRLEESDAGYKALVNQVLY